MPITCFFFFFPVSQGCRPLLTQITCRWWHFCTKEVPQQWLCRRKPPLTRMCTCKSKQHDPQHIFMNRPRASPARSKTVLTSKQHPVKCSLKAIEEVRARNLLLHLCCNNVTKDYYFFTRKKKALVLGKQDFTVKTPLKTCSQAGRFN